MTHKRLKTIKSAFIEAKKILKAKGVHYRICYSIYEANDRGLISDRACCNATDVISKRLDGYTFLENWLDMNCPGARKLRNENSMLFFEQLHQYRLRWLDALIKEFDNEEE